MKKVENKNVEKQNVKNEKFSHPSDRKFYKLVNRGFYNLKWEFDIKLSEFGLNLLLKISYRLGQRYFFHEKM